MTVDDADDTFYFDIDRSSSSMMQAQRNVAMTTTPTNHLPLHNINGICTAQPTSLV